MLDQGYQNLEYIVVDGGSTDGSVEIIERYADHLTWWVSEPDDGQTDALNKGLAHATGDVIAYINSDDYYLPGAFETAVVSSPRATPSGRSVLPVLSMQMVHVTEVWKPELPPNRVIGGSLGLGECLNRRVFGGGRPLTVSVRFAVICITCSTLNLAFVSRLLESFQSLSTPSWRCASSIRKRNRGTATSSKRNIGRWLSCIAQDFALVSGRLCTQPELHFARIYQVLNRQQAHAASPA